MKNIQAIRGMSDVLPDTSKYWDTLENLLIKIATQFGYQEIRFPLVEATELFTRAIGETTDIVEKEMYTFLDRNKDSLTLRPEGTAGCIRAGIEHSLFYNKTQRLFYYGPMFRHERPQKGRYRQLHQFGVEAYGLPGPDIDAELMFLAKRFWQDLKIDHELELQINSLGNATVRAKYREHLTEYFKSHHDVLDEDSKRRLISNPLRILDSKNPSMEGVINNAPKILDHLDSPSAEHFSGLCKILDQSCIPYRVNPNLVRGLDYYGLTVFEWVPKVAQGAQSVVCAGGRYDNLVEQLGGKPTPAIGFALGLERLLSLSINHIQPPVNQLIYFVVLGEQAIVKGMLLAEELRKTTNYNVVVNCGGGDLSTQLKRADKSSASLALILGSSELDKGEVLIKYLRENKPQVSVKFNDLCGFIRG